MALYKTAIVYCARVAYKLLLCGCICSALSSSLQHRYTETVLSARDSQHTAARHSCTFHALHCTVKTVHRSNDVSLSYSGDLLDEIQKGVKTSFSGGGMKKKMITTIPFPSGRLTNQVLIFSITTALALYMLRVGDILQRDAQSTLKSLFGSCELPPHLQDPSHTGEVATQDSNSIFSRIYQYLPREAQRFLTILTKRVEELPRHRLCKHQFSCIHYFSEGFLSRFCLGYAIQTAFNLFRSIPKAIRKPSSIAWSLIDKNNFYLGFFMGGLVGFFRIIMCLLRWIRNKDSPFHALLAGFLSGLSSFAYRSNAIALYFASRIAENLFFFGQRKGFIPPIPIGDRILYTLSTSTILHASVFEPHTIRPAYWQFLLRLTGNYFALMNRKIIDVLGTQASKLYPDFWPKYDPRYVSPQLQTEELYNWWFSNIFQKM